MTITGFQAREDCSNIELFSGLTAYLEGAIYAV